MENCKEKIELHALVKTQKKCILKSKTKKEPELDVDHLANLPEVSVL